MSVVTGPVFPRAARVLPDLPLVALSLSCGEDVDHVGLFALPPEYLPALPFVLPLPSHVPWSLSMSSFMSVRASDFIRLLLRAAKAVLTSCIWFQSLSSNSSLLLGSLRQGFAGDGLGLGDLGGLRSHPGVRLLVLSDSGCLIA